MNREPLSLTEDQMDAFAELINIGMGRAAGMLNDMTRAHITLQIPMIRVIRKTDLSGEIYEDPDETLAFVEMDFRGPFSGVTGLIFPAESAKNLVAIMAGDEPSSDDFDAIRIATLTEIGNIVLNSVMGSITNVLGCRVSYSIPQFSEGTLSSITISTIPDNAEFSLLIKTRFIIEKLAIEGNILMVLDIGSMDTLLFAIEKVTED
jgi:chemotaxis protein CheC